MEKIQSAASEIFYLQPISWHRHFALTQWRASRLMWRSRRVNGGLAYCDLLMQGQSISNSAHCQVTHLLLYNSSCLKLAYPKRKIEKLRRIVSCRARHDAVPSCSSHPIASFLQWQCLGPFLLKQHHFIILLSLNSHNFFHVKCISSHVNRLWRQNSNHTQYRSTETAQPYKSIFVNQLLAFFHFGCGLEVIHLSLATLCCLPFPPGIYSATAVDLIGVEAASAHLTRRVSSDSLDESGKVKREVNCVWMSPWRPWPIDDKPLGSTFSDQRTDCYRLQFPGERKILWMERYLPFHS